MAEEFVGIGIAVMVVTASIVLSGILIGVGRAFGYKRVEYFGVEEFLQSLVNAAIIGSFAAIIELIGAVASSVTLETCATGSIVAQLSCTLASVNSALFGLFQQLVMVLNLLGYYQGMALDFGAFSIAPFANLSAVASALSLQLLSLNVIIILVELNRQLAIFIGQNALGLIFPIGLVLRTFFATRKVGGFLIALALGLFVFYPVFVLVFPNPVEELTNATALMKNFTNNSYYATVPVIDLNDNYAIAGKLDVLSGRCNPQSFNFSLLNLTNMTNMTNMTELNNRTYCDNFLIQQNLTQNVSADFSGDLTLIIQATSSALSRSLLYAVIAPIFSLIVAIVFVREVAQILGSEIGLKTIASI